MRKILVVAIIAMGLASMTGCRGGLLHRFWSRGDACSTCEEDRGCGLFRGGLFGRRNDPKYIAVPVTTNYPQATCGTDAACGTDVTCGTDLGCGTDLSAAPQCNCYGKPDCNCNIDSMGSSPYYEGEVLGGFIDGGVIDGGIIDGEVIDGTPLPGPDFSSETPALPAPATP